MVDLEPVNVLETLGIDNYSLDYEASVVYLPENEYQKLIEYFSKNRKAIEIEEGGWRWVCCERFPDGKTNMS